MEAAKAADARTGELQKQLQKAIDSADYLWYQRELKPELQQLRESFGAVLDRAPGDDRMRYTPCLSAIINLALQVHHIVEQPSDHYRDQANAAYRKDREACARFVKYPQLDPAGGAYQFGSHP